MNLEESWSSIEKFIESLKSALVDEMRTIRETELDRTGGFRAAHVYFKNSTRATPMQIFTDRLNRIVTPYETKWENLEFVKFAGKNKIRVLNNETRYEGDQPVAIVHYLESEETND